MMAIILLILSLLYPQDASENVRRDGAGKENVWDWKGNGVTVLVKYIEIDSKKYLHYEMHQGQEQTVLAHAELRHSSAPTHVKFCAKDQTSFAIFFYDDLTGGVALQEYLIAEKKRKGRKGTQLITAKQKSKGNNAQNNELRLLVFPKGDERRGRKKGTKGKEADVGYLWKCRSGSMMERIGTIGRVVIERCRIT